MPQNYLLLHQWDVFCRNSLHDFQRSFLLYVGLLLLAGTVSVLFFVFSSLCDS